MCNDRMSLSIFVLQFIVKVLVLPVQILQYLGIWDSFYKKFFPFLMSKISVNYNEKMGQAKKDLFNNLLTFAGPSGNLTLLEIGCGTGANFSFFPQGCKVICVDPNPNFKKYLEKSLKENEHLKFEQFLVASGEDLKGVPDGSVDVVVCTLVLCSVLNVQGVLQEVIRVLKPGGAFYFLEHVASEPNSWTYFFQHVCQPAWSIFGDGCYLTREIWKDLEKANFSDLKLRHIQASVNNNLIRSHIVGYAVK
ncbi:methyltransferase-like protein 7A [Latimeria chalumnae]|uniref:Thiol methyltransferase 1A n=1 Tax=Latimeria chalumnae TaxID=7897 RepID=H3BHW7_LATCH|nr:PREDICTED: methyltransferase-like protein 7A [Latimeria chalumnae]|eukprot:XP_005986258.1 PREDICTED: methyltransferase-like protein 7A [Latimeria chalumnae]